MLTAVPRSLFSWDYEIHEDGRHIATIDLSWFREAGEIEMAGKVFEIGRESIMSGEFFLRARGMNVATVIKPSAFHRSFDIRHDGQAYTLRAASIFERRFVLEQAGIAIGEVRPLGIFTRKAAIDFPQTLPIAVRIFFAWLAILLWKRQQGNGGS